MQNPSTGIQNMQTASCPNCSKQVRIEAKFCPNCKQRVTFCLKHSILVRADKPMCEKCNVRLISCPNVACAWSVHTDMKTCNYCGTSLPPQVSKTTLHMAHTEPFAPSAQNPIDANGQGETPYTHVESTSLPPTLDEIDRKLLDLQKMIQTKEAETYFPGDQQKKDTILKKWGQEIARTQAFIGLVRRSENDVEPVLGREIRKHLMKAVEQLNFAQPYEVRLIGHTGAGKSTVLSAILGEDIIPRWSGKAVTAVPVRLRLRDENKSEEQEEIMYVHFNDKNRPTEKYKRSDDWQKMARRFIAESPENQQPVDGTTHAAPTVKELNESSIVDYVEFTLDAATHPELPPHVVLIDLPGGQATKKRQEIIFGKELDRANAVILFAGGNRLDAKYVTEVFEQVKNRLTFGRKPTILVRMMFLVATHWDNTMKDDDGKSLSSTVEAMDKLVDALPLDYRTKHNHGRGKNYPFYPMRGEDAFLATMHLKNKPVRQTNQSGINSGEDYRGRILGVQNELIAIKPTLQKANSLDEITEEHYQAMLDFSGLPEFIRDLKDFLASSRFEVQLEYAGDELTQALDILDQFGWDSLEKYLSVSRHNLKALDQAYKAYRDGMQQRYKDEVDRRIASMEPAWEEALAAFIDAVHADGNTDTLFVQALKKAHSDAAANLKKLIDKGRFSENIKTNRPTIQSGNGLPAEKLPPHIDFHPLFREMRADFWLMIEAELKNRSAGSPVNTLAQAFLTPLEKMEVGDQPLNLSYVSLKEFDNQSDIQGTYEEIKQKIREQAYMACRFMTMSALLRERDLSKQESPAMADLSGFVSKHLGSEKDLKEGAKPLFKAILDEMVADVIANTQVAIVTLFHHELNKFLKYKKLSDSMHDSLHPATIISHDGTFRILVRDLGREMTNRLNPAGGSDKLRAELDAILGKNEECILHWKTFLTEVERIKSNIVDEQPIFESAVA